MAREHTKKLDSHFLFYIESWCLKGVCTFIRVSSELSDPHSSPLLFLPPISDFDMRHFWQWSDFQSYVECIMSLAVVGAVFMYFLNDFDPFVEGVGFAAVFTEAMLGVPQFYRNAKNKSTYGMR